MAGRVASNRYPGVNPHLNSILQTPGSDVLPSGYHSFHTAYIAQLMFHLNERLPSGYRAQVEQSFQRVAVDSYGSEQTFTPEADVLVRGAARMGKAASGKFLVPTWEAAVEDTVDPLESLKAVEIRQTGTNQVVACLELLSPANKAGASYHSVYRGRRARLIHAHVTLVELDLLHETPPIIPHHPRYPQDSGSHPYYYIAVTSDRARVYGFDVMQPLPRLTLPLLDDEQVLCDFDAVYRRVFEVGRLGEDLNYTRPPLRLHTYSAADQQRIQAHMAQLAHEQESM